MHGQGLYTYATGDMYTGTFEHGVKHGQGSYYFKVNHLRYICPWLHLCNTNPLVLAYNSLCQAS